MTNQIHSTAIIGKDVILGENNIIGPYCIIQGKVKIGNNNKFFGNVILDGEVNIGDNNLIYYFATIGTAPQDAKFENEQSIVEIGNNNIIREYVSINGGSRKGNVIRNIYNKTIVGNNCYLYISSHIAHDVVLGNNVVISNNVALGGHIFIDDYTIIGGNSAIHQGVAIGKYCMIGGMCAIGHNIPHFSLVKVEADIVSGINIIGLKRNDFTLEEIQEIKGIYELFLDKTNNKTLVEKIEYIKQLDSYKNEKNVHMILDFLNECNRKGLAI